jgi:hypothetical protein
MAPGQIGDPWSIDRRSSAEALLFGCASARCASRSGFPPKILTQS